jgi:hypothetical protein
MFFASAEDLPNEDREEVGDTDWYYILSDLGIDTDNTFIRLF